MLAPADGVDAPYVVAAFEVSRGRTWASLIWLIVWLVQGTPNLE
jgi:hypothetical protein